MDLLANYYDNALLLSPLPYFELGVYCGCKSTFLKLGSCAPSLQAPLYDIQTLLFVLVVILFFLSPTVNNSKNFPPASYK